jgi:hypothetical protein
MPNQAQPLAHLLVEKAAAGMVGLDPFAVDDELRDSALAYVPDQFGGGFGRGFDVNLGVGEVVLFEEALRLAAIAAPRRGIEDDLHRYIMIDTGKQQQGKDESLS